MSKKDHIDNHKLEAYIMNHYFQGESPGEIDLKIDDLKIEGHLSECDDCAQKAHELFSELKALSDWTVYEDNQTLLNLKVYEALKSLEKTVENTGIKHRLTRWVREFKGLAGGTVKVMMDMYVNGKRKTTKMITEGVEKLNVKNSLMFDYGVEMAPTRSGKNEIIVNFNKVKAQNTDNPLKINLDKKKRTLYVEFDAAREKQMPMGILLPSKDSGNPLLKEPVYNEVQKKWEILFEDIGEGEYYFLFEPGYTV